MTRLSRLLAMLATGLLLLCAPAAAHAQAVPPACQSFTDVITPGVTPVKALHLTELRACIDALRVQSSLSPYNWTDSSVTVGQTLVRAIHLLELQSALTDVYFARGASAPPYSEAITAGVTTVRGTHISELRDFARNIPAPHSNCSPSLSQQSGTVPWISAVYQISVSIADDCSWSAVTESTFLHILSSETHSGSASVSVLVDQNSEPQPRGGSVTIAGVVVEFEQTQNCDTKWSVTANSTTAGYVGLSAASQCNWTLYSDSGIALATVTGTGSAQIPFTLSTPAASLDATIRSAREFSFSSAAFGWVNFCWDVGIEYPVVDPNTFHAGTIRECETIPVSFIFPVDPGYSLPYDPGTGGGGGTGGVPLDPDPPVCPVQPVSQMSDLQALNFENQESLVINFKSALTNVINSCLAPSLQAAGGHFLPSQDVSSAWRPVQYQMHLREVYEKKQALKKVSAASCADVRAGVDAEIAKHHMANLHKRPAGPNGYHVQGLAFDVKTLSRSRPKSLSDMTSTGLNLQDFATIATSCGLTWQGVDDDVHFDLR